jgi:hypothetical protein
VKHYGLKLFFAAAFALTLALKFILYQWQPTSADPNLFGDAVTSFLQQHGFEWRLEKRSDQVSIYANAGKCRMLIREAEPHGWNRNGIELQAKPVGRLSYIFDGAVHDREPFLAPVIDGYRTKMRIKLGLRPSWHPILAIAASDECSINALPWWELGTLS